jgi:hypothetical protein
VEIKNKQKRGNTMKTLKRWMAVVLTLTLLVVSLNQGSYFSKAASEPQIYGEDTTASPGDEIKIPILVKNNPGFVGLGFVLDYDRDVLTLTKTTKGTLLSDMDDAILQYNNDKVADGQCNILFTIPDSTDITGDGQLFVLTFQVADTAAGGTQTIKMSGASGSNYKGDYTDIDFTFTDINVTITGASGTEATKAPAATKAPSTSTTTDVYTWSGQITGWGGSTSYPSSANHEQGNIDTFFWYTDITNMNFGIGYECGLELMNPYNDIFVGGDDEMAVFIKNMENPRIKVTLKKGGAASSWNWDEELSFPSGKELALPDGYLDTGYFALFGNDDTITKVEIYDVGADAGEGQVAKSPSETATTEAPAEVVTPTTEVPSVDTPATEVPAAVTSAPQSAAAGTTSAPAVTEKPNTIRVDIDNYTKVKKPGRVKLKKVKSTGKGKLKITWKKNGSDWYEVQYSTKKNFSKKQTRTAYGKGGTLYLKSKKKYYVRVRGVNYGKLSSYRSGERKGKWSNVKSARVK